VRFASRSKHLIVAAGLAVPSLVLLPSAGAGSTSWCRVPPSYTGEVLTWVGGHGSSWSTGANWSGGVAPGAVARTGYARQFACVGRDRHGQAASVVVGRSTLARIAAVDVGQGTTLTLEPGAELFLGASPGDEVVGSWIASSSAVRVIAATLGGNAQLLVNGALHLTGKTIGAKRTLARVDGPGRLVIGGGGRLLVDGRRFGGVELSGGRRVVNRGSAIFSGNGYVAVDDGGKWFDAGTLVFKGAGGIYRGAKGIGGPASFVDVGRLKGAGGRRIDVIALPARFSPTARVTVSKGGLTVNAPRPPLATVFRGANWGSGGCQQVRLNLCHSPNASRRDPQVAFATTSSEAGAPRRQKIRVTISSDGPRRIKGHRVLGHAVAVRAPKGHTRHSTHLHFGYDASVKGVAGSHKPAVWRNGHRITYCAVHPLTARNPSCVTSAQLLRHGPTKGDLEIMVITIQPNGRWATT
jgi:hypothetical protein